MKLADTLPADLRVEAPGAADHAVFVKVLSDVLERFAFMFVEGREEIDGSVEKGEYLYAAISFSGRTQGAVSLAAPEGLCREMAANVLGVSADEMEDTFGEDALKELLNIVCGELTVALFGNKEVYNLTIPQLYRIDSGKWREMLADHGIVRLSIEGKMLLANLMLVA